MKTRAICSGHDIIHHWLKDLNQSKGKAPITNLSEISTCPPTNKPVIVSIMISCSLLLCSFRVVTLENSSFEWCQFLVAWLNALLNCIAVFAWKGKLCDFGYSRLRANPSVKFIRRCPLTSKPVNVNVMV